MGRLPPTTNNWSYIYELIGPGLQWDKPKEVFLKAIEKAEADGNKDAAEHLRIMLKRRNNVMF